MWGTPVEQERRRRILVALWAYAYEIANDPLVDDATFDSECLRVDLSAATGDKKLDSWFKKNFQPDTGMWVHKHPGLGRLKQIYEELRVPFDPKKLAAELRRGIDEHCAKLYGNEHRKHLGASLIGDPCSRKLWYNFRWVRKSTFDGRMLRLFNRGHLEELRFVEWLRGMGFNVSEYADPVSKTQYRITECNGHFGGSTDGMIELGGAAPKMLLEFKTSGEKAFKKLVEEGVKIAKPVHYAQMCSYGEKFKLTYALYMAVNKNTDEIHVEIVHLDWAYAAQLVEKARQIINSPQPPTRLSENSAYFECKYCDFAPVCHGQESYEKNCRSCAYAQPIEDAQWYCHVYKQQIPHEHIAQGCPQHVEAR